MPMAIEAPLRLHRRRLLALGAAAWAGAPTAAVAGGDEGLLAASAWTDAAGRHHVGLLRIGAGPQRPLASLEVPTRAHGLATLPEPLLWVLHLAYAMLAIGFLTVGAAAIDLLRGHFAGRNHQPARQAPAAQIPAAGRTAGVNEQGARRRIAN